MISMNCIEREREREREREGEIYPTVRVHVVYSQWFRGSVRSRRLHEEI